MYVDPNFPTKKALKEAVLRGETVLVFQPGLGPDPPKEGSVVVEGPHFPKPHTWYTKVEIFDGKVVKVK